MQEYEIIIPVRNGGQALVNSIESSRASLASGRVFLTISDNFSTDGSPWMKTLQSLPPAQWRLIKPLAPLGRVEHWSWAFAQGQCAWLKPLMTGDRIDDAFWKWADNAKTQFPAAGMLFCGLDVFDPGRAHPGQVNVSSEPDATRLYDVQEFSRDAARCQNPPGALTQVLIRADVLKKALPFETNFAWTADWRFYYRCLQQLPAAATQARLVCQDRSIVRFSTSWKGVSGSVKEEWQFASMQARVASIPSWKAFVSRCKASGFKVTMLMGRKILPRWLRGFLTSITRVHKSNTSHIL